MNVKTLKYFIATVAMMSMVCSCGKNSLETPAPETTAAIEFSNVSTKATLDDIQKDGFGVWALLDNATVTDELILNNAEVTYNSAAGSWEYSPLRYWVNESVFTFLAAYPNEGFSLDASNSSLNLTLSETPSQEDYMVATNMTDTSVEGFARTVDLQFRHILTSVRLNIWRDHGKHQNDQMRIRKVTLSNILKGGTYSSNTDCWTVSNERLTKEKAYEGGSDEDNIGAAKVNDDGTLETITRLGPADPFDDMMLVPQTLDGSSPVSLKIQYELKRQNAADWETAELETVLPSVTWEPNRRYTYNVVLSSVTDITVYYIQTKVDPWGTPQVGGTVIIK